MVFELSGVWSAFWFEIIRMISKSNEHAAGMISDQNCTTRSSITMHLIIFILKSLIYNQDIIFF